MCLPARHSVLWYGNGNIDWWWTCKRAKTNFDSSVRRRTTLLRRGALSNVVLLYFIIVFTKRCCLAGRYPDPSILLFRRLLEQKLVKTYLAASHDGLIPLAHAHTHCFLLRGFLVRSQRKVITDKSHNDICLFILINKSSIDSFCPWQWKTKDQKS